MVWEGKEKYLEKELRCEFVEDCVLRHGLLVLLVLNTIQGREWEVGCEMETTRKNLSSLTTSQSPREDFPDPGLQSLI